jgi:hypothetical protein
MASVENLLQTKNDNVSGVYSPVYESYPDGYVDTPRLPIALSWVMSTLVVPTADQYVLTCQVDVLYEAVGQNRFRRIKPALTTLRDLFLVEYRITAANEWLQNDPAVRIVPGTIEFQGVRDLVSAPDGTPYHGFMFVFQMERYF